MVTSIKVDLVRNLTKSKCEPTKNFLSWLECPGINLESAQNAQISKVASGQNDAMPNRTRDIVAQNHSIGTKTVERAAQFS